MRDKRRGTRGEREARRGETREERREKRVEERVERRYERRETRGERRGHGGGDERRTTLHPQASGVRTAGRAMRVFATAFPTYRSQTSCWMETLERTELR